MGATCLHRKHAMKILITTCFCESSVHNWLGAWPCLRKPFSESELLTVVSACLAEAGPSP
jgi:hypothetical protein